jgi:hypothetical protein
MKRHYTIRFLRTLFAGVLFTVLSGLVYAANPPPSLPGSTFEIDTDANLIMDDAGNIDWASVTEVRSVDLASGSGDDSFGQGTKEDTEVPAVVSGAIPPNKSDLKTFGVYLESDGTTRFLHMFWHRVQEPSGTTNMDFEFSQSETLSSNGVTPLRTAGDLLIQYDLSQGGTNPLLFMSVWLTGTETPPATKNDCEASAKLPCWGKRIDLSDAGVASGSINTSAIILANSDGLGALSARTFGEATIDFSAIASSSSSACLSFGSVYLKSRSSDSFTSAVKDFIAPISTNVSNCASLKIIKQDDDGALLGGVEFKLFADNSPTGGAYDPPPGEDGNTALYSCTTATTGADKGACTITGALAGNYWVVETAAPAGHDIADPQPLTVAPGVDAEITFTNDRQPASVIINKKDDAGVALNGAEFTLYTDVGSVGTFESGTDQAVSPVKKCTTASGTCTISSILPPGNYCVDETVVPTGYTKAAAQCFTLALHQTRTLPDFVDPRPTGAIKITKTRKHANATNPALDPHVGVEFTITGGKLPAAGTKVTTLAGGVVCVDGLLLSSFTGVGDYTVTETVPANYIADGALSKAVTVSQSATCGSGNEANVSFANTPLTNITVSASSLVTGGTKSSISCKLGAAEIGSVALTANPNLSLTNKAPGTYICTIVVDP